MWAAAWIHSDVISWGNMRFVNEKIEELKHSLTFSNFYGFAEVSLCWNPGIFLDAHSPKHQPILLPRWNLIKMRWEDSWIPCRTLPHSFKYKLAGKNCAQNEEITHLWCIPRVEWHIWLEGWSKKIKINSNTEIAWLWRQQRPRPRQGDWTLSSWLWLAHRFICTLSGNPRSEASLDWVSLIKRSDLDNTLEFPASQWVVSY